MMEKQNTDGIASSLFTSSPASIVVLDADARVTAWNPAATRLFGWEGREVLGRHCPLIPDDDTPPFLCALKEVLTGAPVPEHTAQCRRKEGTLVAVTIALAPVWDGAGRVSGILCIFNDVTKQRQAEQRAARLNDVLMAIRGVHRLIAHEKNAERLVQRVCECLLAHRGYYTAWIALYGRDGALSLVAEVGIAEYRAAFSETFRQCDPPRCIAEALVDPGVSTLPDRRRTCGGCILERAYAESESILVRLEHGDAVWGFLGLSLQAGLQILDEERELIAGISDDLAFALHGIRLADERRRAEAQAMVHQEQLMQADKMVALGTLVSGIGHEINNPNNFIMLNISLIKGIWEDVIPLLEARYQDEGDFSLRGIPYTRVREMLPELMDDIAKGAWRIKRIVGELKDYARPQPTVLTERVDVNEAVRSAIVLCNTFIKQHTERFEAAYDEEMPHVKGSSQRIEQVVINLVQNACEALEERAQQVTVQTTYEREGDRVVIAVTDQGAGIASADLKRITDPFYTKRRASGGTGLGLSIASRIASDHGGFLDFRSELGRGTTARLVLPVEPVAKRAVIS